MTLAALVYSSLVSAVGSSVGNRIYTTPVPSSAVLPVVAYKQVYGGHMLRRAEDGATVSAWTSRWQVDILATTFGEIEPIRVALINYFDSLSTTGSGVKIYDSIVDMSFTVYEEQLKAQRAITDINIISDGP